MTPFLLLLLLAAGCATKPEPKVVYVYGFPPPPPPPPPDPARVKRAEHVRTSRLPFDWKAVLTGPERVIVIGENHLDGMIRDDMAAHIADIRAAGITHLGMEMLDDSYQALFDRYADGESSEEAAIRAFYDSWDWGGRSYVNLIKAAKGAGLRFVALDMGFERQEPAFKPACPKMDKACVNPLRERHFAGNAERVLGRDKNFRLLVLAGSDHAGPMAGLMRRAGYTAKSFHTLTSYNLHIYDTALQDAGLLSDRLLVPGRAEDGVDGYISLPGRHVSRVDP